MTPRTLPLALIALLLADCGPTRRARGSGGRGGGGSVSEGEGEGAEGEGEGAGEGEGEGAVEGEGEGPPAEGEGEGPPAEGEGEGPPAEGEGEGPPAHCAAFCENASVLCANSGLFRFCDEWCRQLDPSSRDLECLQGLIEDGTCGADELANTCGSGEGEGEGPPAEGEGEGETVLSCRDFCDLAVQLGCRSRLVDRCGEVCDLLGDFPPDLAACLRLAMLERQMCGGDALLECVPQLVACDGDFDCPPLQSCLDGVCLPVAPEEPS